MGQTPTQILRERIAHLQNRIQELENPGDLAVALHHPYQPSDLSTSSGGMLHSLTYYLNLYIAGSESPSPARFSGSSRSPAPSVQRLASPINAPEPTIDVIHAM